VVPTPAAIANAVADAIGVPVMHLPLTAERVLELLEQRADP
jgi:CO/xanthine dehydrogenase Mo-binding subunit